LKWTEKSRILTQRRKDAGTQGRKKEIRFFCAFASPRLCVEIWAFQPVRCSSAALSVRLQKALDKATKAQKIPGATAGVDQPGCSWRGASGVSNIPAHTDTKPGDLFHIGSVTKTFFATLLLKLRAEGASGRLRTSSPSPAPSSLTSRPGKAGSTPTPITSSSG